MGDVTVNRNGVVYEPTLKNALPSSLVQHRPAANHVELVLRWQPGPSHSSPAVSPGRGLRPGLYLRGMRRVRGWGVWGVLCERLCDRFNLSSFTKAE